MLIVCGVSLKVDGAQGAWGLVRWRFLLEACKMLPKFKSWKCGESF
jgi:hypothetical protein